MVLLTKYICQKIITKKKIPRFIWRLSHCCLSKPKNLQSVQEVTFLLGIKYKTPLETNKIINESIALRETNL